MVKHYSHFRLDHNYHGDLSPPTGPGCRSPASETRCLLGNERWVLVIIIVIVITSTCVHLVTSSADCVPSDVNFVITAVEEFVIGGPLIFFMKITWIDVFRQNLLTLFILPDWQKGVLEDVWCAAWIRGFPPAGDNTLWDTSPDVGWQTSILLRKMSSFNRKIRNIWTFFSPWTKSSLTRAMSWKGLA